LSAGDFGQAAVQSDAQQRTLRKLVRRLGCFMLLVTFFNALDRTNVSFAALQMNRDLGFDSRTYGNGVGLFFLGYAAFIFPCTWAARRFGPMRVLSLMMIGWGLISSLLGIIHGPGSFYVLRILLGMCESAVTPLLLFYTGRWLPQRGISRMLIYLGLAFPVAFIVNAPISGWILTHWSGMAGLAGWRWMFLVEGAPAALLGVFALVWMKETPEQSGWLDAAEKRWLAGELQRDGLASRMAMRGSRALDGIRDVLVDGNTWMLGGVLFSLTTGIYGLAYWLPQVMQQLSGASTMIVALLTALPWAGAAAGSVAAGRQDIDARGHMRSAAGACLLAAGGLVSAVLLSNPTLALAGLTLGAFGIAAAQVSFTTVLQGLLRGMAASALALAMINLIGNIAGLVGPIVIGWQRHATGSFTNSIFSIAAVVAAGSALLLSLHARAARPGLQGITKR
jgi:ACS family tartrate transporter-like MFS transporter